MVLWDKLGGKQVASLRADSGFSDAAFLTDLDQRSTHYLIALRLNQAPCWDEPRRIVGIRQKVDVCPNAKGK